MRGAGSVEAWGPLGNGFPNLNDLDHLGLVAGGIGQTPFLAYVRELFAEGEFLEVFVDTPLEACIARDPKGLYAKAMDGIEEPGPR